MKTPLMELIEWLKFETLPMPVPTTAIITKATELLEKEREVIEKAFESGAYNILNTRDFDDQIISKQDYYTKTFTNESE